MAVGTLTRSTLTLCTLCHRWPNCVTHDLVWFTLALVQGRKLFVAWRRAGRRKTKQTIPNIQIPPFIHISRAVTAVSDWTCLEPVLEETNAMKYCWHAFAWKDYFLPKDYASAVREDFWVKHEHEGQTAAWYERLATWCKPQEMCFSFAIATLLHAHELMWRHHALMRYRTLRNVRFITCQPGLMNSCETAPRNTPVNLRPSGSRNSFVCDSVWLRAMTSVEKSRKSRFPTQCCVALIESWWCPKTIADAAHRRAWSNKNHSGCIWT